MKLAVIGTFFKKWESSDRAIRAVLNSTRVPDEFWIIGENFGDIRNAREVVGQPTPSFVRFVHLPTPKDAEGRYLEVPYSKKINYALDNSDADLFVYLDNGSVPHPLKYEMMEFALNVLGEPDGEGYGAGAVYCTQHRTGFRDTLSLARETVEDGFCVLNFTQVMHRKTDARWSLDMKHATPNDVVDGHYWRSLHERFGAFYPVDSNLVLDEHHIPSPAANGL